MLVTTVATKTTQITVVMVELTLEVAEVLVLIEVVPKPVLEADRAVVV